MGLYNSVPCHVCYVLYSMLLYTMVEGNVYEEFFFLLKYAAKQYLIPYHRSQSVFLRAFGKLTK